VLEVGGGLDLGEKALAADDGCQLGLEDLEGDLAMVLEILGQVDGGHAALAELTLDRVAAGQGGVQALDDSGRVSHDVNSRGGWPERQGLDRQRYPLQG